MTDNSKADNEKTLVVPKQRFFTPDNGVIEATDLAEVAEIIKKRKADEKKTAEKEGKK